MSQLSFVFSDPPAAPGPGVLSVYAPRQRDIRTGLPKIGYALDGEFAGDILEQPDGTFEIHVHAGVQLFSAGNGARNRIVIGGMIDREQAQERLAAEFAKVRLDPTLIWDVRMRATPANIKKAKLHGWWQGNAKPKAKPE